MGFKHQTNIPLLTAFVTKALKETAQPIDDIARSCGFKNGNYLKNLFRSRFGMTMREYRERG